MHSWRRGGQGKKKLMLTFFNAFTLKPMGDNKQWQRGNKFSKSKVLYIGFYNSVLISIIVYKKIKI